MSYIPIVSSSYISDIYFISILHHHNFVIIIISSVLQLVFVGPGSPLKSCLVGLCLSYLVDLFVFLLVCLSVCWFVYRSICRSVYLSVRWFVGLSACRSIGPSLYLFIYWSDCLWVFLTSCLMVVRSVVRFVGLFVQVSRSVVCWFVWFVSRFLGRFVSRRLRLEV